MLELNLFVIISISAVLKHIMLKLDKTYQVIDLKTYHAKTKNDLNIG